MTTTYQDLRLAQAPYAESLLTMLSLSSDQVWNLVRQLWPSIERLPPENERHRFRVTMSPIANVLGAALCGDRNGAFHTGSGVLQTLTLVGMCSAVTSHFKPGYALRKIQPEISFLKTVPIGSKVIMRVREIKSRGRLSIFELTANIEGTDEELFPIPRKLTMFKIPAPDSN